jgi:hypothetical protein
MNPVRTSLNFQPIFGVLNRPRASSYELIMKVFEV